MANEQVLQDAPEEQKIDPKIQREAEAYILGLSKMLHSKNTSPKVQEMLKAGDPQETIPEVAMLVNDQMEQAATKGGKKPSLDTLVAASQFLVGDLIEIGNASGAFKLESEDEVAMVLQNTMQKYIEKGLADGSLDPIELQKKTEPLMSEEHRNAGLRGAEASGVPTEPSQMTAMEAYAKQKMGKGQPKGMLQGGR